MYYYFYDWLFYWKLRKSPIQRIHIHTTWCCRSNIYVYMYNKMFISKNYTFTLYSLQWTSRKNTQNTQNNAKKEAKKDVIFIYRAEYYILHGAAEATYIYIYIIICLYQNIIHLLYIRYNEHRGKTHKIMLKKRKKRHIFHLSCWILYTTWCCRSNVYLYMYNNIFISKKYTFTLHSLQWTSSYWQIPYKFLNENTWWLFYLVKNIIFE